MRESVLELETKCTTPCWVKHEETAWCSDRGTTSRGREFLTVFTCLFFNQVYKVFIEEGPPPLAGFLFAHSNEKKLEDLLKM